MFSVSIPAKASMRLDFSVKIIDLVKSFSLQLFMCVRWTQGSRQRGMIVLKHEED